MSKKNLLLMAAGLLCLAAAGCKRHDAVYPSDLAAGTEASPSLSNDLSLVYDEAIKRGKAQDPDLSNLVAKPKDEQPPDEQSPDENQEPAFQLSEEDTSAIKSALAEMLDAIEAQQVGKLPSYFVSDQATQLEKFVPVVEPVFDKLMAFDEAMSSQPDAPKAGSRAVGSLKSQIAMVRQMLATVQIQGIDAEHATLIVPAPGPQPPKVPFTKQGDDWKIEIPGFPPPQVLDQIRSTAEGVLPAVVAKLDELTPKLVDGSINRMQAQMELQQMLMPLVMQVMTGMGGQAASPPEAKPTDTPPAQPTTGADSKSNEDKDPSVGDAEP